MLSRNDSVEHAAKRNAIDIFSLHSETDETAGELIHHNQQSVVLEANGLTAEQIDTPKAILFVTQEGEPRRATATRFLTIVFGRYASNGFFINLDTEGFPDDQGDSRATETRIAAFDLDMDQTDLSSSLDIPFLNFAVRLVIFAG